MLQGNTLGCVSEFFIYNITKYNKWKRSDAKIIAVHMDSINHMTVDRKDVSEYIYEQGIRDKFFIPFDGEMLHFKTIRN